jgi:hypothetical protein
MQTHAQRSSLASPAFIAADSARTSRSIARSVPASRATPASQIAGTGFRPRP